MSAAQKVCLALAAIFAVWGFLERASTPKSESTKAASAPTAKSASQSAQTSSKPSTSVNSRSSTSLAQLQNLADELEPITRKRVLEKLRSPGSAKFGDITLRVAGASEFMTGEVEAQNAFGVRVRSRFIVQFREKSFVDVVIEN